MLLVLGFSLPTFAAAKTWDGGGSDNKMSTAANWVGDVAPVNGDTIVIPDGFSDPSPDTWKFTIEADLGSSVNIAGMSETSSKVIHISGAGLSISGDISGSFAFDTVVSLTANTNITSESSAHFSDDVISPTSINLNSFGFVLFQYATPGFMGNIIVDGANASLVLGASNAAGSETSTTIQIKNGAALEVWPSDTSDTMINKPIVVNATGGEFYLGLPSAAADNLKPVIFASLTLNGDVTANLYADLQLTSLSGTGEINIYVSSIGQVLYPDGTTAAAQTETILVDDVSKCPNYIERNTIVIINVDCSSVFGVSFVGGVSGMLKGVGTVGKVNVYKDGVLSPGQSPGTLTTNDLIFGFGSVYEYEIASTASYDKTVVNGMVTAGVPGGMPGGELRLILLDNPKLNVGDVFTLIENDDTDAVEGTFKDLPEGATFELNGGVFKISYVGGTGNDITLTVIKAPNVPKSGLEFINPWTSVLLVAGVSIALYSGLRLAQSKISVK